MDCLHFDNNMTICTNLCRKKKEIPFEFILLILFVTKLKVHSVKAVVIFFLTSKHDKYKIVRFVEFGNFEQNSID